MSYEVSIYPYDHDTPHGRDPLNKGSEFNGLVCCKLVCEMQQVAELDQWLGSFGADHVVRPDSDILNFSNREEWPESDTLNVVYYLYVPEDKIEELRQFGDSFQDRRS